jgi:glycine/D-amino acid oxidase-like deaminating enzyme
LAKNLAETRALEKHLHAYQQIGRSVQLWERPELAANIHTDFYPAGLFLPHWSLLHPGKLMRGLKTLVERLGVVVYEQTPVRRIHHGHPLELDCSSGQVKAHTVILATNAYTPKLGFLQSALAPLHLFVVVTQPLTTTEMEEGGWSTVLGRFELDKSHTIRLTPDGRLLIRAGVRYCFNNDITYRDVPHAYHSLCQRLQLRYPQLREVKAEYTWSGVMAMTRSFTPFLGRTGKANNILYSAGYNGFGLVNGFYGGKLLSDLYGGEQHEDLQLLSSSDRARRLPPEPLRYVIMNAAFAVHGFRL